MGSSNMDVVITGDVEAQQHTPKWFVHHKHMLRPNQEGEDNRLGYFILKVPEYRRQPPISFSARGWRFGLHNRENLDTNESEAIKLDIAVQYGLVGEEWVQFCDAIVDDPRAMLACYGLRKGMTSWTNEQIKHVLALDALFLAVYMDMVVPANEKQLWMCNGMPFWFNVNKVFRARFEQLGGTVPHDLCRVENQIPLVLIHKVVEYVSNFIPYPTSEGIESLSGDSQYQQKSLEFAVNALVNCFMNTSSAAFKIDNSSLLDEKTHVLGVAYKVICGSKGLLMKQVERSAYIRIPSATKLRQSSIKIVGVDGPLGTMCYKNQSLCLPKMNLYDDTISFIRNMAWYECRNTSDGCLFNDYIALMTDLIQAREDLDLLINYGVIYNSCGMKAFDMWTSLNEGLVQIDSSQTHHNMKDDIMRRCRCRRYRLCSEFKIVFCSRPWLVLSTIAVVLVTMATLVQTYTAIIGSNKMKPKFP